MIKTGGDTVSIYEDVKKEIDALQTEIIDYAKKLIKFPTKSGNEILAQRYVKEVLEDLDFDYIDMWEPDINELKKHEAFVSSRDSFINSPNVVGVLKGTGNGKSLILNSHIDIVSEGDLNEWSYSPFEGTVVNNKIIGRGVSDMKGVNSAIFGVLKAFKKLGVKLKGDLIFQSVIEEETGGAGSLACALRGYKADAAIIPEPVGFKICPAQQGVLYFKINIPGQSFHGGKRYLGVSAIEKAYKVLLAIESLEKHRCEIYASPLYKDVPIPFTINVGTINGGVWPSTVPDLVAIEGRMGVAPGEKLDNGKKMLENWISEAADKDSWLKNNRPEVQWLKNFLGSACIENDHEIVKTAQKAYKRHFNKDAELGGTPFGTDARSLTEFSNTPTIVFGPGSVAHCPDEYLEIDVLMDYTKVLAEIILDWNEYEKH